MAVEDSFNSPAREGEGGASTRVANRRASVTQSGQPSDRPASSSTPSGMIVYHKPGKAATGATARTSKIPSGRNGRRDDLDSKAAETSPVSPVSSSSMSAESASRVTARSAALLNGMQALDYSTIPDSVLTAAPLLPLSAKPFPLYRELYFANAGTDDDGTSRSSPELGHAFPGVLSDEQIVEMLLAGARSTQHGSTAEDVSGKAKKSDEGHASAVLVNRSCDAVCKAVAGGSWGRIRSSSSREEPYSVSRQDSLGSKGVCQLLVQIIANRCESPILFIGAVRAVASMARGSPANKTRFRDAGFIAVLARGMLVHFREILAVTACCAAISALAEEDPQNRERFGTNNCLDLLVESLRLYDPTLVKSYKFVNFTSPGVSEVASATQVTEAVRLLVEQASSAIAQVTLKSPHNRARLGALGACEVLVQVSVLILPF